MRVVTYGEARAALVSAGWTFTRYSGNTHEIWRSADGTRTVTLNPQDKHRSKASAHVDYGSARDLRKHGVLR